MKPVDDSHLCCIDCSAPITTLVFIYSSTNFGLSLCKYCQDNFKEKSKNSTREAIDLYIALRKRKVPAELEKWDGHKTIDIAVVHAKLNIEVDGQHHNFHPEQAMSDLKRSFYAFQEGYLTLRIPNSLVKYHLEDTADYITDFLIESRDQIRYN